MSDIVVNLAVSGAQKILAAAKAKLDSASAVSGETAALSFPDTAFKFPAVSSLVGQDVTDISSARKILSRASAILDDGLKSGGIPAALAAGEASIYGAEIIKAVDYLDGTEPQPDCDGFFSDTILRTLGIQLADGRLPGFAAILGAAPDSKIAVSIVRELQKRSILIFAGGVSKVASAEKEISIIDQLKQENIQTGWDNYIATYGRDTASAVYPLDWAMRGALTFGGVRPGSSAEVLRYTKERVLAFVLALGPLDEIKVAAAAAAILLGFPVITDQDVPEIPGALIVEKDYSKIVERAAELRGIKVKITKIDCPVPVSPAFEGERVRKEQTAYEFGGKYTKAFEYLRMLPMSEVVDGKIDIIGPDLPDIKPADASSPARADLGLVVEVAGRKMQRDFEPILERQIHHYLNYAMGIFHMGQRDLTWMRISKEAAAAGFRLRHLGEILRAKFIEEYPSLVDKVRVTVYTDTQKMKPLLEAARRAYDLRDERVASMTDESVDTYYSCTLCQSYAPNHVCVITPEKLGLCGAYNWLDGKAAFEINPKGMNQPIKKGSTLDAKGGEWNGVNDFVKSASNRTVERFANYGIMENPTTSCGCFEAIVAVMPEANGVIIVNRGYSGQTPVGMTFTTLASSVGGGNQVPGFLGIGRLYVASAKFLVPEGGIKRIVWMTKEMKEFIGDKVRARAAEAGVPDFLDMIADETVATDPDKLLEYLAAKKHPALAMPPIIG
ncbi:MAG: CO dehydrogenase/CO-methylating acetyl-CoA synthase complex subunit beta [Elusimicrobia bacterium HGW-Elusimicrobia-1]|jgi:acetyl-CoA synthase|nr:MAG: CO dehydrogenase/CO-methylating acetyl-CoA synthase complex subunit beta [Elusimicrobia bacterium HGW-Elusimicrobia-1]